MAIVPMPPAAEASPPSFVAATTGISGGTENWITMARPAGLTANDVMVAQVAYKDKTPDTVTAPPGWVKIREDLIEISGNQQQVLFYKVATASEPVDYTFNLAGMKEAVGGLAAFRGVDTTNPIDAHGGQSTLSSNTITAPSITTTVPDTTLVGFFSVIADASIDPPPGMTERWDAAPTGVTFGAEGASEPFVGPGPTGARIASASSGANNIGQLVALTPSSSTNQTPVFNQDLGDRSDTEGALVALASPATDPDLSDVLTYGATGLPPGLSIDNESGLISGTIDYSAAATSPFVVTITAADDGVPSLSATPDTFTWTVSNTNRPPTIADPGPQTAPELTPFTLVVTATDPDGELPSFSDGGTLPAWAVLADNLNGTATISGTPDAGDSGTASIVITVSDGGVPDLADTTEFDITVTNTNLPPTITNPGDQIRAEGSPFRLVVAGSDPDGTTVSFTDTGTLPGWATLVDNGDNTATVSGTPSYTDAAITTVTVTVTDGSLTDDAVFAVTVINTNRAPLVDPIADATVAAGAGLVPIVATASDPDGTIPSLSASGLPGWASFLDNGDGTATIAGTPGDTDAASATVTVTASDGSLTDDVVFDLTVTNTNQPPVLDLIGDQPGEEQTVISFTATASDPDSDGLVFTLTGGPTGAIINPDSGVFTWTPGEAHGPGSFTAIVVVTDDGVPARADSQVVTIAVAESNLPPTIAPISDQLGEQGDEVDLEVVATDPDLPANEFTFTSTGLPPGLIIDPASGSIRGTIISAATDESRHPVEITVTDQGTPRLSATTAFVWTVGAKVAEPDANLPPTISPIDNQFTGAGSTVNFSIGATDSDLVSFAATGLPAGLAINPGTGLISGTVAGHAIGSHDVTITVTDSGIPARRATATFTWTVTDLAAAVQKEDLVQALDNFETSVAPEPESQPIRRSLVVMGSVAAATSESLRWPIALLVALLLGFATVGRVGLYPLLWRGERQTGTITLFDPELNFGLIEPDEPGEAVHVHANAFPRRLRPTLDVGMRVRYRVLAGDNRSSAWGATADE